jgi:hypothetical protein
MKTYLFIILIISISSYLVFEVVPYSFYESKTRKELKEIGALHSLEEIEFDEFEYQKDSFTYSLSSVQAKSVFFNTNMPVFSVESKSPLTLSFSWEPKNGQTNYISPYHLIYRAFFTRNANDLKSTSYEVEFEVEVSKFKFTKTWEKASVDDNFIIEKGFIDNTYTSFKVKSLEDDFPFSQSLLLEVVIAFLNDRKTQMNEVFNTMGVEAYYKSLPFEGLVQKVYTQTSNNIPNENNIDLTVESIDTYDSGLIIKRKGKLNDLEEIRDNYLTDFSKFTEGNSQNFNIHTSLIENLVKENLFNIVFEQSNNPSTEYELTVSNLKKIVDVSSSYPDTTELKILAEMDDAVIDGEEDLSGSLSFTVKVISKSDLETLLTFSLKISFTLTPTLLQNGLNFVVLSRSLNILEVKSSSTIKDEALLRTWIENTYLVALGKNEYNLFTLDIDLSKNINNKKKKKQKINKYNNIKKK